MGLQINKKIEKALKRLEKIDGTLMLPEHPSPPGVRRVVLMSAQDAGVANGYSGVPTFKFDAATQTLVNSHAVENLGGGLMTLPKGVIDLTSGVFVKD